MSGATGSMRGLAMFISDIRGCGSRDAERARVDKELANIRAKFKQEKQLTAYDRKKYVWKMLYIYMLGYDVDFGHMEAVGLISAPKYGEKQVGYLVTSVLLNEDHEFLRLVINTMRNDIISRNETFQCLALTAVGNLGGKEFAEAMSLDVQAILCSNTVRPLVRKKAALCLLRLFRKAPETLAVESWVDKLNLLLEEKHVGVLTAVMTLFLGLVSHSPEGYEPCVPHAVRVLERTIKGLDVPQHYTFYAIPSPWLQVKTLRVLQYFASPEDPYVNTVLHDCVSKILNKTNTVKNTNKNNAVHAILFEAVSLVMHLESDPTLMTQAVTLLGSFVGVKEPNIRYLALENMSRLSLIPDMMEEIKAHQSKIVEALKDADISIRRRALDLLYGMCDKSKAKEIVEELLAYLVTADFAIREELTLKVAILSEKYAPDLQWYLDVMLQLLEKAGDFVSDDVWFRVVQIVTNNPSLQRYAAERVLEVLESRSVQHEMMVKVGAYVLGEFGHTVPGLEGAKVFALLNENFLSVSPPAKMILLSAYMKIATRSRHDTATSAAISAIFQRYNSAADSEIQQRAIEYGALFSSSSSFTSEVMKSMPKFPERQSALVKQVEKADNDAADVSINAARRASVSQGGGVGGEVAPPPLLSSSSSSSRAPMQADAGLAELLGGADLLGGGEGGGGMGAPPPLVEANGSHYAGGARMEAVDPFASPPPPPPPPPNPPPPSNPPPPPPSDPFATSAAPVDPFASSVPAPPSSDPFGDSDPFGGPPPPPPIPDLDPPLPITDPSAVLKKLLMSESGVLYEDQYIQVGIKSNYENTTGTVMVFLGNKHSTIQITNVRLHLESTPRVSATCAKMPPSIDAGQQIRAEVKLECLGGFEEQMPLDFAYTIGAMEVSPSELVLPISVTKFMTPVSLEAAAFFGKWRNIAGPPLKLQEVVNVNVPLAVEEVAGIFKSVRLGASPNIDPNPANSVAAATFASKGQPPAGCLVRLEADPNDHSQYRLTTATDNAAVSAGLMNSLKVVLGVK